MSNAPGKIAHETAEKITIPNSTFAAIISIL